MKVDNFYTLKEVAQELKCSLRKVEALVATGDMPSGYLPGTKLRRVSREQLDDYRRRHNGGR